jgi:hypothetical protein
VIYPDLLLPAKPIFNSDMYIHLNLPCGVGLAIDLSLFFGFGRNEIYRKVIFLCCQAVGD